MIRTRVGELEHRTRQRAALPAVVTIDLRGEWTDANVCAAVHRKFPLAPAGWMPAVVVPEVLPENEWTRMAQDELRPRMK